jgi:hypothetical protein
VKLDDRFNGSGWTCYVLKDVKEGAECCRCVFMTSHQNQGGNCDIETKRKAVPVYAMTAYGGGRKAPSILKLITSDGGGGSTSHSSHSSLGGIHSRSGRPGEE